MKIKFKTLKIHNFLSFEDAEVNLNASNFTMVKGVNENPDDGAMSNGSGKSSLFEAINWCLTGETIRGTKEVKRLGTEEACSVTLDFDVDGKPYKLTRTKDPSNLKIYIDGDDRSGKGIRDSEKLLHDYLPDLTSSLIGSVIILGQGLPQRFSNNTPSGRKEVLEKLSKSDFMIEDIKRRVTERRVVLSSDIRTTEDTILSAKSALEVLNQEIMTSEKTLKEMNSSELEQSLKTTASLLNESSVKLNINNDNIGIQTNEISKLEEELQLKTSDGRTKIDEINNELNSIKIAYSSESSELSAKISMISSEITKLDNVKDVCPTCGQKLPNVHKVDTTKQKEELKNLNEKLSAQNKQYSDKVLKLNKKLEIAQDELKSCTKPLADLVSSSKIALNSLMLAKNSLQEQYNTLTASKAKLEADLANFKQNKDNLIAKIDSDKVRVNELSEKIVYNNSRLDNLNDHFEIVNKMNTLISRDFRGYLLTNVIDFINKKSKEYARELFGTDKINFTLDGNNISISYDEKEYETLSGGERQKVDVIVQLAIRNMLCTYLEFSSNILVLDEISDNIDATGAEKLFNLITTRLTDVDSIFIISHHSDFDIPTDNEIIVNKGIDKISRII